MVNMNKLRNFRFRPLSIAILIPILVALACGGNATPELVGTVEKSDSQESVEVADTPPEQPAEVAEPTEQLIEEATETPPTEIPPTVEQPQSYAVGDVISIGDSVLTVLGWEDVPGNDFSGWFPEL